MRHYFVFALLLLFLPFPKLAAQAFTADEAADLLNKVSTKYKAYTDIESSFSLLMEVPDEPAQEIRGKLFMKNEKFRIELDSLHTICDGKTIWNHLLSENEVQINVYEPEEEDFSPNKLFSLYNEKFIYRIKEKVSINKVPMTVVELSPVNKKLSYFKIDITINPAAEQIHSFKVYEKNGIRSVYTITSFSSSKVLKEDLFTFNSKNYPGIEVVDLR